MNRIIVFISLSLCLTALSPTVFSSSHDTGNKDHQVFELSDTIHHMEAESMSEDLSGQHPIQDLEGHPDGLPTEEPEPEHGHAGEEHAEEEHTEEEHGEESHGSNMYPLLFIIIALIIGDAFNPMAALK